jgi:hypothetical protein
MNLQEIVKEAMERKIPKGPNKCLGEIQNLIGLAMSIYACDTGFNRADYLNPIHQRIFDICLEEISRKTRKER